MATPDIISPMHSGPDRKDSQDSRLEPLPEKNSEEEEKEEEEESIHSQAIDEPCEGTGESQ